MTWTQLRQHWAKADRKVFDGVRYRMVKAQKKTAAGRARSGMQEKDKIKEINMATSSMDSSPLTVTTARSFVKAGIWADLILLVMALGALNLAVAAVCVGALNGLCGAWLRLQGGGAGEKRGKSGKARGKCAENAQNARKMRGACVKHAEMRGENAPKVREA